MEHVLPPCSLSLLFHGKPEKSKTEEVSHFPQNFALFVHLALHYRLTLISWCSLVWIWIPDPPVSAFWVLGSRVHAIVPSQTGALLNCFIKVPNMLHGVQASGHTVISELIPAKVKGEVHFLFLHCFEVPVWRWHFPHCKNANYFIFLDGLFTLNKLVRLKRLFLSEQKWKTVELYICVYFPSNKRKWNTISWGKNVSMSNRDKHGMK